jgi:glycosyl hydrolase family 6
MIMKAFSSHTSRNGHGPDNMQAYAGAPYDQPTSVISTLAGGNWCNPPGSGLGLRPTASTGGPLLDAYLWVKTPGQSDGQCDSAGGVRAWDYIGYTQPGWPQVSLSFLMSATLAGLLPVEPGRLPRRSGLNPQRGAAAWYFVLCPDTSRSFASRIPGSFPWWHSGFGRQEKAAAEGRRSR